MALPSTGPISLANVRSELNLTGAISLGQGTVRALAGKATGAISLGDLRGKSLSLIVTPGTVGGTVKFRGYSQGHAGGPTFPAAEIGAISATDWQGTHINAIGVYSTRTTEFRIFTGSLDQPLWTTVTVNGVAYSITWVLLKLVYEGLATIPNAYASLNSEYTVSFS